MLMLPETQRVIQLSDRSFLVVIQLIVLFPLFWFLPIGATLLAALPLSWVLYASYRKQSADMNRWLLMAISILAGIIVFLQFGTFRGKDAGVSLFVVMYSLKILESKKYRDLNLLLTLGFFVHSMTFLFTQSWLAVVYMFFAYGAIVYSLMRFNAIKRQGISWKASGKLLLYSLPIVILLFLFFPRLPGPLWKMPNQNVAGSGVTDSMTPGDINALNLLDGPAFRVKFENNSISTSEMYWRGLVFDDYDGFTWRSSDANLNIDPQLEFSEESKQSYTITLEPTRQRWLFALDVPQSTTPGIKINSDRTISAPFKIEERIRYRVTSDTGAVIKPPLSEAQRQQNLQLPEDNNPQARQWAEAQFENIGTAREFVAFLLRHINTEPFYYTLTPPIMQENMVDDFWFDKQQGFCEHYAGSVAFMLRAVGVPARVVVGYHGGEFNQVGEYYLVRQRDAHAWLEYWQDDAGWVRVDPTSAIDPSRIDDSLLEEVGSRGFLFDALPDAAQFQVGVFDYMAQWMDNAESFWQEWVIDFNQSRQWSLMKNFKLDKVPSSLVHLSILILVAVAILLISKRLSRQPGYKDKVGELYGVLLKKLARRGLSKQPSEGSQTFIQRAISERPDWRDRLGPILRDYQQLRYHPSNRLEPVILKRFKKSVRNLRLD